jgi:hypothetical protein
MDNRANLQCELLFIRAYASTNISNIKVHPAELGINGSDVCGVCLYMCVLNFYKIFYNK